MKIWLTKNSEVSIRDQLFEQISLGIASGDLKGGERLPSVRELARRFEIHLNTVSAAYRELAEKGHVEFRKGSGVYVRTNGVAEDRRPSLDSLLFKFLSDAEDLGYSPSDVQKRLTEHLNEPQCCQVAVVESDPSLCKIIVEELAVGADCEAFGIEPEDLDKWLGAEGVVIAAMFDEREKLQRQVGHDSGIIFLSTASVPNALKGRRRPADDELIAVVSGWQTFLSLSRLFLVAAKIDPESIITRNTGEAGWERGLEAAGVVIGDMVSVKKLAIGIEPVVFRILSDESVEQVRQAVRIGI